MEHFAIIDSVTGKVVQTGLCQEGMALRQRCRDGQIAIRTDTALDSRNHYFNAKGGLVVAPDSPAAWAVFDVAAQEWIDPRDAAQRAAGLRAAKADAIDGINAWAGVQRQRYITTGAGQEMIYLAKQDEAVRWIADPAPDPSTYPMISPEVGVTAQDEWQLAQLWSNMSALWLVAGAAIEGQRLRAIAAIDQAPDPAAVQRAVATFRLSL